MNVDHINAHRHYLHKLQCGGAIPFHMADMRGCGLWSWLKKGVQTFKKFGAKAAPYVVQGVKAFTQPESEKTSLPEKLKQIAMTPADSKVSLSDLGKAAQSVYSKVKEYRDAKKAIAQKSALQSVLDQPEAPPAYKSSVEPDQKGSGMRMHKSKKSEASKSKLMKFLK